MGKKQEKWDGEERRAPARVLVVNNDPDAAELLVRLLERAGYRTSAVHDEQKVIGAMVDELSRCVVLDMASGGIAASLSVLDTIRTHSDERVARARVVLCAPTPKNRSFSFQSGADAFLVRPFHARELTDLVADVLARPEVERAGHRRNQIAG